MENKNILIGVVILLVMIGSGYWLTKGQTGTTQNPTSEPNKNSLTVEYSGQGFSPNSITVKSGTTVTWVNKGSDLMWVASSPHPVHTDLLGFDALKGASAGSTYSFTFTKVGKWSYHNHLAPGKTGKVVIE